MFQYWASKGQTMKLCKGEGWLCKKKKKSILCCQREKSLWQGATDAIISLIDLRKEHLKSIPLQIPPLVTI